MIERVLCMEDDEAQARLARKCLERAGYIVDVVGNGEAGLAACEKQSYDAVVVDQTMPGMSGLDVLFALDAWDSPPPTIMVTGTGNEHIAVEAMKLGTSDYLIKDHQGGFVKMLPLVVGRAIAQRRLLIDRERIEQELSQAQRMEAIGELASGIAHEINTPTQYIGDNTRFLRDAFRDLSPLFDTFNRLLHAAQSDSVTDELLEEAETTLRNADLDYLNREIPQAIQQSLEGVEHVANIVGAMKEFSHPGNGRKQNVDLNHLIEGAVTLCQGEWRTAAELTTDYDQGLPEVQCHPTDINRVTVNLVVNAAHAVAAANRNDCHHKGVIKVRTRYDEPYAEIRVEDNGVGIPEDILPRIFDMFFTTKEVGHGSGQGLALVHTIVVEKHGGTIRCESEVGRGTTFIVRLPVSGWRGSCVATADDPACKFFS